jgi:transcriptional regulator with XRE-family HTH domain
MSKYLNVEMLGKRIQQGRLKKGFTQFALAEDVGVSQNFLGDVERGLKAPSITTCIRLSNILGISLNDLFNESLEVQEDLDDIYLTDKQVVILKKVVKEIKSNFFD